MTVMYELFGLQSKVSKRKGLRAYGRSCCAAQGTTATSSACMANHQKVNWMYCF